MTERDRGELGDTDDVLGVSRSVTGRRWARRLDDEGERLALALAQRYGLPDVVARVLAGRGITLDNADSEMAPTLRQLLPDPSRLTDCDALVERLADAVDEGCAITLFADYDVDGATSAAVVHRTLSALGAEARIIVPDRVTDGYGPSVEGMRALAPGTDVIVTLDCGAGAVEPVEEAKRLGLTVLVIDHHPVETMAPADAVVNPNRPDDLSGLGACAAVGVAFIVMVGLVREMRRRGRFKDRPEPNLLSLLDCVALGTVADIVPLTALNRAFVTRGLTAIQHATNPGLAALAATARIGGPVEAYHLGYVLGPRINAGGRVGDAGLGARLLTSEDRLECDAIAERLEELNRERRALEAAALTEALAMVDEAAPVILVAGSWHPGVVGLVAARLKERHRKPAIAIALTGKTGTGSARSIKGVDLGAAVRGAVTQGLLVKGGGHPMAAGLTVNTEAIGPLANHLNEALADDVAAATAQDRLTIDGVISPGSVNEDLARALTRYGPYGAGRPKPVFAMDAVIVQRVAEVGSGDTLRLGLKSLSGARCDAVAFRTAGPLGERLKAAKGAMVNLAVEVSLSVFRGIPKAEVVVVDVADITTAASRSAA
ncbi:MAG: single-stranded-DNA-specific exonuclease RecJ [Devosia sp.]